MELTASGRPFLYFPLGHYFEQQIHVRHRLDRHDAGRCWTTATRTRRGSPTHSSRSSGDRWSYVPVPTDGAVRAAQLVAELI